MNDLDHILSQSDYGGISQPISISLKKGGEINKISKLEKQLNELVLQKCSDYECDGTSRIIYYYGILNNLNFKPHAGALIKYDGENIVDGFEPHIWNEIKINGNDYIVDYKARIWLGESAPHGIIKKNKLNKWHYIGEEIEFDENTSALIYALN